jgi:hypothetical protein
MLDLETPGVVGRLKDVPAKHSDLAPAMDPSTCPTGDKLIDSANPDASWFLKKIKGQQGGCGTAMPQPPTTLTAAETMCLETFVSCVAGKALGGGSGGSGSGGSGGGSGGSSTGGGGASTGGGGSGGAGGTGGGSGGAGGTGGGSGGNGGSGGA